MFFHALLLEQDTIIKKQIKKVPELGTDDNSKEYKIKRIRNSVVYAKEVESNQLPCVYYILA